MKKIGIVIFILCCFGNTYSQQEKKSFSLLEAQQFAVDNSKNLQKSKLEIEIAKKKIWEITATGLPQIGFEGQFQHFLKIPTTVVDASVFNPNAPEGTTSTIQLGTKYNTTGTLKATQLIFDGSYIVGLQVSKFYKKHIATTVQKTEEDIRGQVAEAYYNVLIAQENTSIQEALLKTTSKLLNDTKTVYNVGMIEQEKVDQLELTFSRLETSILLSKDQLKIAKAFLKLQLHYDFDKEIFLTDKISSFYSENKSVNHLYEKLNIEENLNYKILEQKMKLSEYDLKRSKFLNLPRLAAFFQQQYSAQRNAFNFFNKMPWFPTSIWGLSLNIPITSSGNRWAVEQQAKIKVEQDKLLLEDTKKQLEFTEKKLKMEFNSAVSQLKLEKKNIALAQKIYKNNTLKSQIGKINMMDVTQSQTQLLQAQGNYIRAISKVLIAKNELDKLYRKHTLK